MALLKIKPTANGGGNYKGKLSLQISCKGTTQRAYTLIVGVKSPDLTDWNEKQGKFIAPTATAIADNATIATQLTTLKALNELGIYSTPKDLKNAFERKEGENLKAAAIPTFAQWLEKYVKQEKERGQGQSTNYQLYNTLRNKLLGVNEKRKAQGITTNFDKPTHNGKPIADIPVNEINTACYCSFANWVIDTLMGKGYKNLTSAFAAAVNHAAKTLTSIDFPRINTKLAIRPVKTISNRKSNATTNRTLTPEDIANIEKLDLSQIAANGNKRNLQLLGLYRDTALLVYYLGSRPADIIQLHKDNYNEKEQRITYTPFKLTNRNGREVNICLNSDNFGDTIKEMNAKALGIITKYKDQSKGGYLLPLPINEKDWGDIRNGNFKDWEVRRKNTVQRINEALNKIAVALNIEHFTLYSFRRGAITAAIKIGNENAMKIARRSGTSVKQIDEHYYNDWE